MAAKAGSAESAHTQTEANLIILNCPWTVFSLLPHSERETHTERGGRHGERVRERQTDRDRQRWETGTQKEREMGDRERWETERERWHGERERGIQTDRQTDRQTQTDRGTNRQMERELTILACLALTSRAPGMRDTAIAASFAFFFSALLSSGGENRIHIFHFPQSHVLFVD